MLRRFLLCSAVTLGALAATPPADPASKTAIATDPTDDQWHFASRLSAAAVYDDNIFIRPQGKESDFILRAAPSIAYGIGNFLPEFSPFADVPHFFTRLGERELPHDNFAFGSYTPEFAWFSDHSSQNAINHDARLVGRTGRELWALQGQLRFRSVEDANIDVGRRLRQNYYHGDGSASYELGGRTRAGLSLQGEHTNFSGGFSSDDVRVTPAIDYQLAPKTVVGLGLTVGYLSIKHGGDQTFERPLLRLKYRPTEKLSFSGEAGTEFRHFSGDLGDRSKFVFSVGGEYEPTDGLDLSLTARRDTIGSAQYVGENLVTTTYEGKAKQRFLQRHYLALAGGFMRNTYEHNRTTSVVSRRDEYFFGKAGVSRDFTKRGAVDLSYEYRSNNSSAPNFGFNENVLSLAFSFLY